MPVNISSAGGSMSQTATVAKAPNLSWLKKGQDATAAMAQAEYQAEVAKESADRMWRFFLEPGEERKITFLDGDLTPEGGLSAIVFHEHTVQIGPKKWENFACVAETENCPICASGNKADTVAAFTVCDHTPRTIKSGPKAGEVVEHQRKLFICKQSTFRDLRHYAAKRGGLRGWTIEVGRMSDKDARVGKSFQFVEQQSAETLASWGDLGQAADYAKELTYLTAAELVAAGIAKAITGPGYATHSHKPTINIGSNTAALADQM